MHTWTLESLKGGVWRGRGRSESPESCDLVAQQPGRLTLHVDDLGQVLPPALWR